MLEVREYAPVVLFRAARSVLGHAFYHTAAYWIDGLLVDTTCAYTARELLDALSTRGLAVEQIVNTHCHEDHIGGNGLLQQAYGIPVLAHPLTLPILANPKLQYLQPYRRFFWGRPQPSQGQPLGEWVETAHCRFQVLHTPGHSPDHVCLYEPNLGWLFTGDAYIGGRDRAARPDYDIYEVIASLKRLAALELTALFPGSGSVRVNNPVAEIQQKITYLEELGAKVQALYRQGYSVQEIQRRLLGGMPSITYLTQGHFRRSYLIQAYLRGSSAKGSRGI
nr:MBL fold metallo-hydrolase [Chloroflexota bacterium]